MAMESFDISSCNFDKTSAVLKDLFLSLTCNYCKAFFKDPVYLSTCDHTFCRGCVANKNYCPECNSLFYPKEIYDAREIADTMNLCQELQTKISFLKEKTCCKRSKSTDSISRVDNGHNKETKQKKKSDFDSKCAIFSPDEGDGLSFKDTCNLLQTNLKLQAGVLPQNALKTTEISSKLSTINDQKANKKNVIKLNSAENCSVPLSDKNSASTSSTESVGLVEKDKYEVEPCRENTIMKGTFSVDKDNDAKNEMESSIKKETKKRTSSGKAFPNSKVNQPTKPGHSEKQGIDTKFKALKSTYDLSGSVKKASNMSSAICSTPKLDANKKSSATPKLMKKNTKGETLLHTAVVKDKLETVRQYLNQGASCNVKDFAGWTPLHEACNNRNVDMVRLLLDFGALVDTPGYENHTPLHEAVLSGNTAIVEVLLSKGADATLRNSNGQMPLDIAVTPEMLNLLQKFSNDAKTLNGHTSFTNEHDSSSTEKIVMLCSGLDKDKIKIVEQCAGVLNANVASEFSSDVTHLICVCNAKSSCPRTLKFMQSILSGIWTVNNSWVDSCLKTNTHVNEEQFEVSGTTKSPNSNGPKMARLNATKQFPRLFDGCSFYFQGNFNGCPLTKKDVVDLVKLGGGVVLNRRPKPDLSMKVNFPFHVNPDSNLSSGCYIIYHNDSKAEKMRDTSASVLSLPVGWLLDCITNFSFVDPKE